MLKKSVLALSCLCVTVISTSAHSAENAPKWGSHIEAEGKWGTDRSLGEIGVFMPVWQDADSLVFTDLRGRLDDSSSQEGNFGIGIRHQVNKDWILGGYAFYDHRKTPTDNEFDQATFGIEALSEKSEFRFNAYLPEKTEKVANSATSIGSVNGTGFQIQTGGATKERALPGVDIEMGRKLDIPGDWEFWAYAGGYHFEASGYDHVTGPRGRVEATYHNLPYFSKDTRLTLGIEAQHDNVRDGQAFAIARLRIPLGAASSTDAQNTKALSALDKRMTTRIYRDVDIVSGEQELPSTTETATVELKNGTKVSSFATIDATGDLEADITTEGANAFIIVDGSAGTINVTGDVRPLDGQTVIGGGAEVTITGDTTGTTTTLTLPGTRPTITPVGFVDAFFIPLGSADNVTLQNMDITNGNRGISLESDGHVVRDVRISNTGSDSMEINSADNILLENVTLISPDNGGEEAIEFERSGVSNVTLRNVRVENANIGFIFVEDTIGFALQTYSNVVFDNVTVDDVNHTLQMQDNTTLDTPSGDITSTNVVISDCDKNGTGSITSSSFRINSVLCN